MNGRVLTLFSKGDNPFWKGDILMKVLLTSLFFISAALFATPPQNIPPELFDAYTDGGKSAVVYNYLDDSTPKRGQFLR